MSTLLAMILLIASAAPLCAAEAPDAIVGDWLTSDKQAKVHIAASTAADGSTTCTGAIIWLGDPLDEGGKPRTDANNPDSALRAKPIVGLAILNGAKHDSGGGWQGGTVYDPKSGKSYSCTLTLEAGSVLKIRGYIGISLLGRTERWTRVAPEPKPATGCAPGASAPPAQEPAKPGGDVPAARHTP